MAAFSNGSPLTQKICIALVVVYKELELEK
jgi:hypothetical protein